ncbi:ATP-binding cassette domain-containing protein [Clostridium sp. CTA-19]
MISATKISKTFKIKQHCGKGVIGNLINPQYTEKVTVENFNVIANDCEIIGIIGLNGAGKTTIIKMLCGIMKPDKGTIFITCRIALNKYNNIDVFIIILVPIMLMIIFFYVFKNGVKKYDAVNM